MPKTIAAFLQLIRLPNVVTAAADSLAGWLLATGTLAEPGRWLPLTAASMILYASGTALNDVFDMEIDRVERPSRPLPSGRISRNVAAWLGGMGLLIGLALASLFGSAQSALVAAILAVCILSYDAGVKHTWLGPPFMGACRGLNLLLGLSAAGGFAGPIGWLAASAYGLYVAGITVVSRSEAAGGNRGGLAAGFALENIAIVGLCGVALSHNRFPNADLERPLIPLEGLLVLGVVAMFVNLAASRAIKEPIPELIQRAVKTGILTLVWLHVGVVAAVRGFELAAIIAALWVPAFLLGKWLYST
jgi:4-hydroxybenzoate polyprenyltransferase